MLLDFREYQKNAIDSTMEFLFSGSGNPLIGLPTGTGKSAVVAGVCDEIIRGNVYAKILVLVPGKELIGQNHRAMKDFCRNFGALSSVGFCSASYDISGLNRAIVIGTIGTVIKRFNSRHDYFTHIIIDEAHLVSEKENTQYQKFIKCQSSAVVVGLTATPYRLGLGTVLDNGVFTDFSFNMTDYEGFSFFVREGYLAKLVSPMVIDKFDLTGIKKQQGEFSLKEMQSKFDKFELTVKKIEEFLPLIVERKKVLIFSTGIEHSDHIAEVLIGMGESAVSVHSKSPTRDADLAKFKNGEVRFAVNFNVLTTGFDEPGIDCIIFFRATTSPGLLVQMAGRGTRPVYSEGADLTTREGRLSAMVKRDCLILDYCSNIERLGTIDDIRLPRKRGEGGDGGAPFKNCAPYNTVDGQGAPCYTINSPRATHCVNCGIEFKFLNKIEDVPVISPPLRASVFGLFETDNESLCVTRADNCSAKIRTKKYTDERFIIFTFWKKRDNSLIFNSDEINIFLMLDHGGYAEKRANEQFKLLTGKNYKDFRDMEDALECIYDNINLNARKDIYLLKKGGHYNIISKGKYMSIVRNFSFLTMKASQSEID